MRAAGLLLGLASGLFAPGLLAVLSAACSEPKDPSTGPAVVDVPVTDGLPRAKTASGPRRQPMPASGAPKETPFPPLARTILANGLSVDVVRARALPIVHARLLVRGGSSFGAGPGVGSLTAHMLKDGGTRSFTSAEVLRRVETLGSDIEVVTEPDHVVLSLALTKDKLAEGLSLLAEIVRSPRFDDGELRRLKARSIDDAENAARSNGVWTALWVVFHELYPAGSPYSTYGALPSQIARVERVQIEAHHRRFYVPRNATLVLAGDVDEPTAKELAQKHFGGWTGGEAPKVDVTTARPLAKSRVIIAHRPRSVQSDVYVAGLAPERRSERWAHVRVATQILGGGVASRLFADVREQRSLAYRTGAQVLEVARGEQPVVLSAGTESSKTGLAVKGLLENMDRMKTSPPTSAETEIARRYLSDVFAIRMETVGAIASMVVAQESFGLPDGYWDTYRRELRATAPADAAREGTTLFGDARGNALIVVAGDADVIGADLARFGEVTVVDPEKEFKTVKTIPSMPAGSK